MKTDKPLGEQFVYPTIFQDRSYEELTLDTIVGLRKIEQATFAALTGLAANPKNHDMLSDEMAQEAVRLAEATCEALEDR